MFITIVRGFWVAILMYTGVMTDAIRKSAHLRILPRDSGGYVAYHALFGNLRHLNDATIALLDFFDEPRTPQDYATLFERYPEALNALHDAYYLVEESLDERGMYGRDLERRRQRLRSGAYIGGLQLSVSDTCNFACRYCFCDFVDRRGEERRALSVRRNKLMTVETARKTIDALIELVKRNDRPSLVVKFFGREPLTNWRLIRVIMEHYGQGEAHGIQIAYATTTNGSLVTPEIAATLAHYGVTTTVSVDGVADSNDPVRVTKKGQGETFELIDRGLSILSSHRAVQVLSAVITDANFEHVDGRFIDYALTLGVHEVQVLLGMQGDFIRRIDPETAAQKLFDIHQYGRSRGVAVTGYWNNALVEVFNSRRTRSDPEQIRGVVESCTATGHQLSVEPSGDIFPCRAMSTHMGHIDDLPGMLASDVYENVIMRTYGNVEPCRGCPTEGFCQGECLGNLEEKYSDIYAIDPAYCDIYRRVYDKVLTAA